MRSWEGECASWKHTRNPLFQPIGSSGQRAWHKLIKTFDIPANRLGEMHFTVCQLFLARHSMLRHRYCVSKITLSLLAS
jgi:hypothetical protein